MSKCYATLRYTVLFLMSMTAVSLYSQSLACNGGVNISMDSNCEVILDASHILKGTDQREDPSGYILTVKNLDGTYPTDIRVDDTETGLFDSIGHVGTFLKFSHPGSYIVEVRRLSDGVKCWGDLVVEDKLLPFTETCPCDVNSLTVDPRCELSCASVPAFLNNDEITRAAGLNPTFRDNCGNTGSISFLDELVPDTACGGWIITRTWRSLVPDAYGVMVNKDLACKQRFYFKNNGLSAITPPSKTVVVTCGIDTDPASLRDYFSDNSYFATPNPDTALMRSFPTLRDTLPSGRIILRQIGQGLSGGTNDTYCKITGTYTDSPIIPHCGDIGYKFVRTWHLIDWCTNETIPPITQIIKVDDNEAPYMDVPDTIAITSVDPWKCDTDIRVPAPDSLSDNCAGLSQITWIAYVQYGGLRVEANMANGYTLTGLPTGSYIVTYVATDICNNAATRTSRFEIRDLVEPVALTKHRLKVTFTQHHGMCVAKVYPYNVDAGSFDACDEDLDYAVRRLGDDDWADFVKFTDADISDMTPGGTPFGEVMVELRVRDDAGNQSIGWTTVVLEDKNIQAVRTCGQTLIHLACTADVDSAIVQYKPTVTLSGCSPRELDVIHEIRSTDMNNSCNTGTVVVDYFLPGSVDTICTKTFRLSDIDALSIVWPAAEITVACDDTDFGDVVITGGSCNNAIASESLREISVPAGLGYCKKIIRELTVIDWCVYQPNTGDDIGVFTFRQVIKVEDDQAPVITCTDTDTTVVADCGVTGLVVTASGMDAGSCSDRLIWSAEIDVDANGSFDYAATMLSSGDTVARARIDRLLPAGVHIVRWTAQDDCGNISTQSCSITVIDDVAPNIVCLGALSTATMSTDGSVTLWASDFDVDSDADNCGGTVSYSFSGTDRTQTNKRYTCDDLPDNISVTLDVVIYAWDESGNVSSCTARLRIDDNQNNCRPDGGVDTSGSSVTSMAIIAGAIVTQQGVSVEAAEVSLKQMSGNASLEAMTELDGHYAFANNVMHGDYELSVRKSDDHLNGVTTIDLILLQRHILGINRLEDAYHVIAADANGDGKVSALDMVTLRKLIIGRTDQLPGDISWRFVDAAQDLDPASPWPLQEAIAIRDLDHDMMAEDFIAIKIGDINGNAVANSSIADARSDAVANIVIPDHKLAAGETVQLSLSLSEVKSMAGAQMSLQLHGAQWIGAESPLSGWDADAYMIDGDQMNISWVSDQMIQSAGDQKISISFVVTQSNTLSDIISLSENMRAEAYGGDYLETTALQLSFGTESPTEFVLEQNVPNPFEGSTAINFTIGKRGMVEFSIFDLTGRQLYAHTATYEAGRHKIEVDESMATKNGVLYYQMTFDNKVNTRKMISIE